MTKDRLRAIAEEEQELEMTPMIDVTFLLLVFFLCTLKFKTLEGKLAAYLPEDVGQNDLGELVEKVEVGIRVLVPGAKLDPTGAPYDDPTRRGRFVYDASRRLEYSVGTRRTSDLGALEQRLDEIRRERRALGVDEVPITLDAREGTTQADVVGVLDMALGAGFRDVTFAAARPARE
jgi:biopolymer transport protein ExbD